MVTVLRPRDKIAKKNSAFILGEQAKHDTLRNCVTCTRWTFCQDPAKSFRYRCTRYQENSIDNTSVDDHKSLASLFGIDADRLVEMKKTKKDDLNIAENPEEDARLDEVIAEALSANSPIPPDIKIKDAEIPHAANFYEWLIDERFTGGGESPFPRQIWVGGLLFAEFCSRCSDMNWLERMKVDATLSKLESKATFLNRGVCPSCKVDRGELVEEGEIANPLELVLICGQRSAKTSSVNLMDSYNIHRYLKLANPSKVYKQLAQQVFTVTYTSSTFGQVRANMWEPFLNIANGSAWFSNYHKFLNRRGHELGEELYNVADIYIRYRHRNLFLSPATPSGQTMRGRTRLSAAIDEISHMPLQRADGKDAARGNAKDTYTALRNSLKTLQIAYKARFREGYFDIPKPLMYDASSPLTINDYGMTLLRMSKVSDEMLGFKYKTWEFNPHLPESEFANDFKTRPIESARDYACEPPIGQSTWLTDMDTISNAFTGKRNMFDVEQFTKRSKSGKKVSSARLKKMINVNPEWGCVLAVDIGAVNNSIAFSVSTVPDDFDLKAFVDEESESEEAQVGLVPMRTLFVGEVIPNRDAEISQNALYKSVFSELCEILPINLMISDRWQNKKMQQDLEEEFGIDYYEYKLRWEDFENLKEAMYEKLVKLPRSKADFEQIYSTTIENYPQMFKGKPIEHLIYQFMTVQEARGNGVIKGDATDDMFRCIALSHAALQDKEMLRLLLDVEEEPIKNKPHIGVVISAKNGTSLNNGMALTPRGASTPRAMAFKSRRS